MKSPLRPFHKPFKAATVLKTLVEPRSVVHSFLFFSGMPEFDLVDKCFVVAHTTRYVIYEFWRCLQENKAGVVSMVSYVGALDEKLFYELQELWLKQRGPEVRAAYFFLLNRHSEQGFLGHGTFAPHHFNPIALQALKNVQFENFYIQYTPEEDFLNAAAKVEEGDYLLFPVGPYSKNFFEHGKNSGYEETKVYHRKLLEFFKNSDKKCILLYFKHRDLFKLYKDYNITMIDQWGRITDRKEKCTEMIIANF
tara:strand:- start:33 stop:788 length:756 start_codon:yes stop_codon:yes gene_type:complete